MLARRKGVCCEQHDILFLLQNSGWQRGTGLLEFRIACQPGSVTWLSQVTVELKNDLAIQGTLHSVDQYLNIKLHNTRVVNEQKYPHMVRALQQQKFYKQQQHS